MTQSCPLCYEEVSENPRYPDYLCRSCVGKVADRDGRPVIFCNASPNDSNLIETLRATYSDGTAYMSQICYVDGVECRADEARFGGIVVRPHYNKRPWG